VRNHVAKKLSTSSGKATTLEGLEAKWSKMSTWYAESMQMWSQPGYQVLFSNLRLQGQPAGLRILEVGCGPGDALLRCLPQLPEGSKYTATDYSTVMVAKARKVLPSYIKVCRASGDDLPFSSASFDRYISNLCLMLVPSFEKAVVEAARVLSPGGVLAVTLWGDRSSSPYFTIKPKVMKALGIAPTSSSAAPDRSNFHVADRGDSEIRKLFLDRGFDRCTLFHSRLAKGHLDGKEFAEEILGDARSRGMLKDLSKKDQTALLTGITKEADNMIEQGIPLALDVVHLFARRAVA